MVAPQPFFRARGTPFSVLHRIRALVENGYSVDLVTYPFGEDVQMQGLSIHRSAALAGIKDVKIGPSIAKLALDVPLYRLTARLLKANDYDLVHSHEEAAFFCVGLARRFGLPHLYDMHSSLPQQLDNFGKFNFAPVRRVFESLENHVLSTCDGVITICEDLAKVVAERKVAVPHSMIENTADDRKVFPAATFDARERWNLIGKEVILYTGTFETYQGLDLLREAFSLLAEDRRDARLLLVGGRPEQVEAFGQSLVGTAIADRVTLTGTVHPSEIPSYVAAADLIVSPRSSGTNTPLKIYGYMRTGKPLVATDRWTHTQTLTSDTAELVSPTPAGLASGISRVLDDKSRAQRLADAAQAFADANFSDAAYVDKVLRLYRDVFARLSEQTPVSFSAAD